MKVSVFLFILLHLFVVAKAEDNIETSLSRLLLLEVPVVDFDNSVTVEEAVDYLNLRGKEVDPPHPKSWKLILDVPKEDLKITIPIKARNIKLYEIVGKIADRLDADFIVSKEGMIIRKKHQE